MITLSEEVFNEARGIPVAKEIDMPDSHCWELSGTGSFTVSSAYHLISGNMQKENNLGWVWNINCIERVHMFIWLVMKSSILTNAERLRRGMDNSGECPRCSEEETLSYLFRDCRFAVDSWQHYGFHRNFQLAPFTPCLKWVEDNCSRFERLVDGTGWWSKFRCML